jgi:hypothetical protein
MGRINTEPFEISRDDYFRLLVSGVGYNFAPRLVPGTLVRAAPRQIPKVAQQLNDLLEQQFICVILTSEVNQIDSAALLLKGLRVPVMMQHRPTVGSAPRCSGRHFSDTSIPRQTV